MCENFTNIASEKIFYTSKQKVQTISKNEKQADTIMGNFFTSLFSSSKGEESAEDKVKNESKNFDILKYDGVRAQRINKMAYAIKCYTEALNIKEDFETMSFLVAAYTKTNELEKAIETLDRMIALEPERSDTRLARVNLLFMLDRDAEAATECDQVIELDPANPTAYFSRAKARKTTHDLLGTLADLTKAIALKEDFADAYLQRAEVLLQMGQAGEALPDAEKAIELAPEEENAY